MHDDSGTRGRPALVAAVELLLLLEDASPVLLLLPTLLRLQVPQLNGQLIDMKAAFAVHSPFSAHILQFALLSRHAVFEGNLSATGDVVAASEGI